MTTAILLAALAFIPMLLETRRSTSNARVLRARGAREPDGDVYSLMQVAYPASFLAMTIEAWLRGTHPGSQMLAGAVVFAGAKALKYWAIATLGERWTFRVLVPPGSQRVVRGPYRWLRHPNYVGVMGELVGFALLARAPISGTLGAAAFLGLILVRLQVEERALGLRTR